ncbi:hypothetical protein TWF191_010448 [Orbilia oligospora]|uniref:Uncharacterized protein n=1 Tax=Orbilia oligospora TaxID=2813651 RepID=A0A7C8QGY3_ORBOL|nr:hypothetical protein TWF191_010448 [Orbilia oligospora]
MGRMSSLCSLGVHHLIILLLRVSLLNYPGGVLSSPVPIASRPASSTDGGISTTKTVELSLFSSPSTSGHHTSTISDTTVIPPAKLSELEPSTTAVEAPPAAIETSPYEKRVLQPSYFYEGGWRINCAIPDAGYNLIMDYTVNRVIPDLNAWSISLNDWEHIMSEYRPRFEVHQTPEIKAAEKAKIAQRQVLCSACRCTEEGRITSAGPYQYWCPTRIKAARCGLLYACFCTATLGQPQLPENVEYQEVQDALNRIPNTVRADRSNVGWTWQVDPRIAQFVGHRMTYSNIDPAFINIDYRMMPAPEPTDPIQTPGAPENTPLPFPSDPNAIPPQEDHRPYYWSAPLPPGPLDYVTGAVAPPHDPGPLDYGVNIAPSTEPPQFLYGPEGNYGSHEYYHYNGMHWVYTGPSLPGLHDGFGSTIYDGSSVIYDGSSGGGGGGGGGSESSGSGASKAKR